MTSQRRTLPYGSWPSPITAERLARGGRRLGEVRTFGTDVFWLEGRPTEGGRQVVMRRSEAGEVSEVTRPERNVRTLVHEYGGGAYTPIEGGVAYADFADQRVWIQPLGGGEPAPVTPEPAQARSVRYADLTSWGPGQLVAVRESHPAGGGEAANEIIRVDLHTGAVDVVAGGDDFYRSPRPCAGGDRLAFVAWNHPDMPWDGTELRVIAGDGPPAVVAGGPDESVQQPTWASSGALRFVSDRTGWWNLYEAVDGDVVPLCSDDAEYGEPGWVFGEQTFVEVDGHVFAVRAADGRADLVRIDAGHARPVGVDAVTYGRLAVTGDGRVATVVATPTRPAAVVLIVPRTGATEVVRASADETPDERWVSLAESLTFATSDGGTAHALWYPPHHPEVEGPADESPPLVVMSHGGPTSATDPSYRDQVQFWTTRGVGVVDVNYRGSTGYGRAYRNELAGRWGVYDTDDCIAAARHLADAGLVDGARMAIRGGSAGGYTTLCALTFHDVFSAGCSLYGVADAEALARDTHKFESRYLDRLIGPYPESADLYRQRSPIHHTERLSVPMILLQGLEDAVVPPSQAEAMVDALRRGGIPFAYLPFAGEQHGFRQAATIERAAAAELSFYGRIFGFEPADELEEVPIENL